MTLRFNLNEEGALAFNERYLHYSKTYQRTRMWVRLGPPLVFLGLGVFQTWSEGRTFIPLIVFGVVSAAWWFFYGRRFDSRGRERTRKHMREDSYAKNFGPYEVQLLDKHLASKAAIGSSTYNWSAVERVEIHGGYLFIFLSGPLGHAIEVSQVGLETAEEARDFVMARMAASRAPVIPPPLSAAA